MRVGRFAVGDELLFGVIENEAVAFLKGHPFGEFAPDGRVARLDEVRLVAPVLPSKIIAMGQNYVDHAREMGSDVPVEPLMFLKPSTCVIGPRESIVLPWQSERVDHEAELAVVIGRVCRDIPEERVPEAIFGYTCANDVTARDLQASDGQWTRAKGFDSFGPLGPWIETEPLFNDAEITCTVNGKVRQHASTADLVRGVNEVVAWISTVMTLLPGDVILTGTPAGVGPVAAGDEVAVTIAGLGTLSNPVTDSA